MLITTLNIIIKIKYSYINNFIRLQGRKMRRAAALPLSPTFVSLLPPKIVTPPEIKSCYMERRQLQINVP